VGSINIDHPEDTEVVGSINIVHPEDTEVAGSINIRMNHIILHRNLRIEQHEPRVITDTPKG
jgi:hypothetical protein